MGLCVLMVIYLRVGAGASQVARGFVSKLRPPAGMLKTGVPPFRGRTLWVVFMVCFRCDGAILPPSDALCLPWEAYVFIAATG